VSTQQSYEWHHLVNALILLHGGPSGCGRAIGVSHAAVSKWSKGIGPDGGPALAKALSQEKAEELLNHIGLIDGRPDPNRVHIWYPRRLGAINALSVAYKHFFPNGAEMRVAPWSSPRKERWLKLAKLNTQGELHALSDGKRRVLIRCFFAMVLRKYGSTFLREEGGISSDYKVIDATLDKPWTDGVPTIREFDKAWGDISKLTDEDMVQARFDLGLTPEEAIRRMRRPK